MQFVVVMVCPTKKSLSRPQKRDLKYIHVYTQWYVQCILLCVVGHCAIDVVCGNEVQYVTEANSGGLGHPVTVGIIHNLLLA